MAIGSMDAWPEMGGFSTLIDPKTYSFVRQYSEEPVMESTRSVDELSEYRSIMQLVLSEDDLFEGAKIFTVGYGRQQGFSENTVAAVLPGRHYNEESGVDSLVFLNEEGERIYCSNLGIPPHSNKDEKLWSEEYVSFINNKEIRRQVADWLLLLNFHGSVASVSRMIRSHPEDYPTELFIMDGQILVRRTDS